MDALLVAVEIADLQVNGVVDGVADNQPYGGEAIQGRVELLERAR